MSCAFFARVRARVRVFGIHIRYSDRVMVMVSIIVRLCGYAYTRGWGLRIRVQSTEYYEKREKY